MNRIDFNLGVRAAAAYLVRTAEDYEQRLPQRKEHNAGERARNALGWAAAAAAIKNDEEKARLLRGQADNILRELSK